MVLFFAFSLVVVTEVLVWSENRKFYSFEGRPRDTASNQKDVNSSTAARLEPTMVLVNKWLYRLETEKGSRFEFEKLSAVGGATLGVDDKWVVVWILFAQSLSRDDVFFRLFLVVFGRPIKIHAP